jgi:hypothetical protein
MMVLALACLPGMAYAGCDNGDFIGKSNGPGREVSKQWSGTLNGKKCTVTRNLIVPINPYFLVECVKNGSWRTLGGAVWVTGAKDSRGRCKMESNVKSGGSATQYMWLDTNRSPDKIKIRFRNGDTYVGYAK